MIRIYTIRGVLSMRNTRGCGTVSTCVNRHFSRHERFGRLGQESVRISIYNPKTPAYKRTIRRATTSDERKGRNYWRFHCSACRSAYKAKNQRSSFLPLTRKLRLVPEDSDPRSGTSSQVAVLGYEFWQSRFGGALDVVGKQIRVEGHPFTIIGVTRKWFTGLSIGGPPDITIPITAYPQLTEGNEFTLDTRSILWLSVIGRLKDGITIEQARAQLQSFWLDVLLATASTETPGARRERFLSMGLEVTSAAKGFRSDLRTQFTRPLYVLAGIVGLILLVA